jgi:cysteine desulfurase
MLRVLASGLAHANQLVGAQELTVHEEASGLLDCLRGLLGDPAVMGDPGRVHSEGRLARTVVEQAREQLAAMFKVPPRSVVFTSGGTEAVNAACWGALASRPGRPVLCSALEHSSVREASARSAEVIEIAADGQGRIDLSHLDSLLDRLSRTGRVPALVHCQLANHEVGTIEPLGAVAARCHEAGALLHVDLCAAAGHMPVDVGALGADLASVSAHKFGGPQGAGALLVRKGLRVEPFIIGGAQERSRRAGIENLPAIAGFGALAARMTSPGVIEAEDAAARRQIATILDCALGVDGVSLVGDPDPSGRLGYLACLVIEGVEGEPLLLGLDQAGIAVHSGSACSSESFEPSPVLSAIGAEPSRSLRVSVGWSTSDADVEAFCEAFPRVLDGLRSLSA